eukprot:GSChrysophyteH1.ASY1.ANO1.1393.1 assembled CDS
MSTSIPTWFYFNPLGWVFVILDIVLMLITFKWLGIFKSQSPAVQPGKNGSTRLSGRDNLANEVENNTAWDRVKAAFDKFGQKRSMGTRKYLGEHLEEGERFPKKKFGAISWRSYNDVAARARSIGKGKVGGAKFEDLSDPHTVLIYEETCSDWLTFLFGSWSQSLAVATSYATLGVSAVADAVLECNVKVILCNHRDVDKITAACGTMPCLTHVIYTDNNVTAEDASKKPVGNGNVTVMSLEELIVLGTETAGFDTPPAPDNMAVVMYTSDALHIMAVGTGLTEGVETYLAYLPAAHILELAAETTMFCFGAEIGYSDPKTISSKGASDETQNFAPGGIQAFRPTFMAAVPKIWDILKKGVEDGLGQKPGIVQGLMKLAFAWRAWMLSLGMDTVFFMVLIKKLRPLLGGRQKVFVTGGGPIASEVQTFVRTMLGAPLVQGYALTETSCSGTVQYSSDRRDGVVGPPVASVEIKLRDCMDVLIRGPAVGSGYLKQPDKTAEAFDEQGWFHTGDIAIFTPDGCLKIVDRLKNLVKLKGGEYIAIESIMCYGDGSMDRPVAMVQVNLIELRKVAASMNKQFANDEEMCNSSDMEKAVLQDLVKEGKAGGVSSLEVLIAVKLISGRGDPNKPEANSPWTPDNLFLTASNKLNRKPIQQGLESDLQKLIQKGIK